MVERDQEEKERQKQEPIFQLDPLFVDNEVSGDARVLPLLSKLSLDGQVCEVWTSMKEEKESRLSLGEPIIYPSSSY